MAADLPQPVSPTTAMVTSATKSCCQQSQHVILHKKIQHHGTGISLALTKERGAVNILCGWAPVHELGSSVSFASAEQPGRN